MRRIRFGVPVLENDVKVIGLREAKMPAQEFQFDKIVISDPEACVWEAQDSRVIGLLCRTLGGVPII